MWKEIWVPGAKEAAANVSIPATAPKIQEIVSAHVLSPTALTIDGTAIDADDFFGNLTPTLVDEETVKFVEALAAGDVVILVYKEKGSVLVP